MLNEIEGFAIKCSYLQNSRYTSPIHVIFSLSYITSSYIPLLHAVVPEKNEHPDNDFGLDLTQRYAESPASRHSSLAKQSRGWLLGHQQGWKLYELQSTSKSCVSLG